jgi:quercetin dioxygenase-like cupin family protein
MHKLCFIGAITAAISSPCGPALAQEGPIQQVELQRLTFPPDYLSFLDLVTIPPAGADARATHVAQQIAYVLEGELELTLEGQPRRALKPGMSFKIPAGVQHSFKNAGPAAVKLIVFGVEKDQPGTPAP